MAAIDIIGANYDALKVSRRRKEDEARERINHEMEALQREFDLLVFRAKGEGAKISHIAARMGASRTTVYDILSRAIAVVTAEPLLGDPLAQRYSYDRATGILTISLEGDIFALALKNQEYTGEHPELSTADFTVVTEPGRVYLDPLVDFMPEIGNRHPVTVWTFTGDHEAEALAWVAEQEARVLA